VTNDFCIFVYGILNRFCADLTVKQLENNSAVCEQLLRLADVLEPGITRFRGLLLYYLVPGLKQLKRKKHRRVGVCLLSKYL